MTIRQTGEFDDILSPATPGTALPRVLRRPMQRLFDASFETVRVHFDSRIAERGALALTNGENIFMPPAVYQPGCAGFRALLAHELAHVVQQRERRAELEGKGSGVHLMQDAELEAEADRMALTYGVAELAGHADRRNVAARPVPHAPVTSSNWVQCVLLHARDARGKVNWVHGKNRYRDDQVTAAKRIIEAIAEYGTDTLSVTGLNQNKFGHESTGQNDANPANKSVSVWWKQSFGAGVTTKQSAYQSVKSQNNLADSISVCGLGTHIPEYQGKPAYQLHWVVDAGLANRFYLNNNTVTRMQVANV